MRINVIGGGPSGLFFAFLMKRSFKDFQIKVFEQNHANATFGFGVVFSGRALRFLAEGDPQLVERLTSRMERWSDQHITIGGETIVIDGSNYAAIERLTLLRELREACASAGVEIAFETRIGDPQLFDDCDVVVGADGANSIVRDRFSDAFGTHVRDLGNFFAWYGVDRPYPAHTLTFKRENEGVFCGHHYRYTPDRSTFVAEVDGATWYKSGMHAMSNDERRKLMESVFADTLAQNPLLSNKSIWKRYRLIDNDRWHFRNTVLLGDALRSAHPSIGSGTRLAMEDSIALWKSFLREGDNVARVFESYESSRRPIRDKLNSAAERSIAWYESLASKMELEPIRFAWDYCLRTGVMTSERLRKESPLFVERYEAQCSNLAL